MALFDPDMDRQRRRDRERSEQLRQLRQRCKIIKERIDDTKRELEMRQSARDKILRRYQMVEIARLGDNPADRQQKLDEEFWRLQRTLSNYDSEILPPLTERLKELQNDWNISGCRNL